MFPIQDKGRGFPLMLTVVPGMEDVAEEELIEKTGAAVHRTERGKLYFNTEAPFSVLKRLRTADNIYFDLGNFRIGPHKADLPMFITQVKRLDLAPAFSYLSQTGRKAGKRSGRILVSASRKGKHTYSRFDLSEAAQTALLEANPGFREGEPKEHDFAFRFDVAEDRCCCSLQLTTADFKFRGEEYDFSPGCIRPSVAHALVRMSAPAPHDVFYDPFCGSGSIPKERAEYKARAIYASDLSEAALGRALFNLPSHIEAFCADAAATPMRDGSISTIVTNLPWGKQIVVQDIYALYCSFLKEAGRILTREGTLWVLTDQYEELVQAAAKGRMQAEQKKILSLHGLLPAVYRIKRL